MGEQNYFINLLISIFITLVVILIPYIVIRLITHRRIQEKTAKIITILCSIISFLVFIVLGILTESEKVTVFPILLWNAAGYYIIKPRKAREVEKEDPGKLLLAEMLSQQNIKQTDMDILPDKISSMLKTEYAMFAKNQYALSDTFLFAYYIISYYVSNSHMLETRKKEFLRHINSKLLASASNDFHYDKNEILELWKKRNDYVKNLFVKSGENLNLSEIINEFILIYNYDISENKYVEINENTPIILQGFDDSITYNIFAKSFFDKIIQTVEQIVFYQNITVYDSKKQNEREFQQTNAKTATVHQTVFNEKAELINNEQKRSTTKKHRPNKATIVLSVTTAIFCAATIGLTASVVYQDKEIREIRSDLFTYKNAYDNTEDRLDYYMQKYSDANYTISKFRFANRFYTENVACVNTNSTYYHKPTCTFFDDSSFKIYSIKDAEARGYSECPYCF